jgi:hypothetical protein
VKKVFFFCCKYWPHPLTRSAKKHAPTALYSSLASSRKGWNFLKTAQIRVNASLLRCNATLCPFNFWPLALRRLGSHGWIISDKQMFTKHMMGQHVSCSEGNKEWWKFLKHKDALEQQTMLLHCDFMNKSQDRVKHTWFYFWHGVAEVMKFAMCMFPIADPELTLPQLCHLSQPSIPGMVGKCGSLGLRIIPHTPIYHPHLCFHLKYTPILEM